MQRSMCFGLLAGFLLVNCGCQTTCERRPLFGRRNPSTTNEFVAPAAPVPLVQAGSAVAPNAPNLPPGAVLNPPPGANIVQPGQQPPTFSNPSSGQQPPTFSNPSPGQQPPTFSNPPPSNASPARIETQWQSTEAREPAPRVDSSRDVPPRINLYAPEPMEKDKESDKDRFSLGPPQLEPARTPSSDSATPKKPAVQANFPAIPQFAVVKENVYAGLRPPLDGLDWLQANGVQAVVQLRLFGEDDVADRRQVEKRNMRYLAFEVSPQSVSKEKAEEFIRLIRDNGKQGIFVYDQDGSLAGAMWYLYMRLGENYDHDAAQLRARPLGLHQNREGQQRDMWLAVMQMLNEK